MGKTDENQFKGTIKLDLRDSKPDWNAFLYKKAPKDAPNVLVILYDDTGCAAWSPYGGRISMPTMDRLAANGLTYTQWHTTAVCSPTRSCFLTGRNHHANGFGSISEMAVGFPGYCGHIPPENGTIAQVLRDAGWSTFWIGKNHNVPVDAFSIGATKKKWPLGLGYDRFYGFIGGETNQWYPTLIEDNHFIDQPYQPEDGYHLSKDLADKAIAYIRDTKQSEPDKPWYMWYCPGANHAPHHDPQEYIDKYKGKFDDGYEAYREWVLARMIERGIVPENTELTPINPLPDGVLPEADSVRPWDSLSADEKKLFARMAEVYAAFSEYTDVQVGRVIDYLEESGQLDNTVVFYCADNGWKAATLHAPVPSNQGNFDKDVWQLFNVEEDRAEAHDLAAKHPDKLKQLQDLWLVEAERTLGSSFKALAEVEFTNDTQGVIFAQGSRFGGYSLFVKNGKVIFVYNFLGIPPEQRLDIDAPTEGKHIVGVEFEKQSISKQLETLGQMKLYVDDKVVAEAPFRTQSGHYALCGEGLSIGIDTGDSVSSEYMPNFEFTGGRLIKVIFDVAKDAYVNVEKAMAASMARD
ncbi:MAG TPA: sulfatase-like hydrolase/transferase [Pyrinomonadaceae bacterium]|nr:sulfatase-like hydrolase/transferase [Pyrinomonadaceae bacterium]